MRGPLNAFWEKKGRRHVLRPNVLLRVQTL